MREKGVQRVRRLPWPRCSLGVRLAHRHAAALAGGAHEGAVVVEANVVDGSTQRGKLADLWGRRRVGVASVRARMSSPARDTTHQLAGRVQHRHHPATGAQRQVLAAQRGDGEHVRGQQGCDAFPLEALIQQLRLLYREEGRQSRTGVAWHVRRQATRWRASSSSSSSPTPDAAAASDSSASTTSASSPDTLGTEMAMPQVGVELHASLATLRCGETAFWRGSETGRAE